jgi:hypothetical protein
MYCKFKNPAHNPVNSNNLIETATESAENIPEKHKKDVMNGKYLLKEFSGTETENSRQSAVGNYNLRFCTDFLVILYLVP